MQETLRLLPAVVLLKNKVRLYHTAKETSVSNTIVNMVKGIQSLGCDGF